MPQMSPMNWIIISMLFTFMIMIYTPLTSKKMLSKNHKTLNTSNISWKW